LAFHEVLASGSLDDARMIRVGFPGFVRASTLSRRILQVELSTQKRAQDAQACGSLLQVGEQSLLDGHRTRPGLTEHGLQGARFDCRAPEIVTKSAEIEGIQIRHVYFQQPGRTHA
jgi:hypothetical protein